MKIRNFLFACSAMVMVACSSDDDSGDSPATGSCEKPTDLIASQITTTAADLSWTKAGSATTWDIELGPSGFEPTGEPTASDVTNPYTATGLTVETTYEFYVRADCGNDQSEWSGPLTFTTSPMESSKDYFPLAEGNSWTYTNKETVGDLPEMESEETMTAGAPTEEDNTTYYPMETDNPTGSGFATSVFTNGTLHQDGGQTFYNGEIAIAIEQLEMNPVEITLDNAVILSETASAGTELFTHEGSETQNVNIGVEVPVTINYTATTTNVEFSDSYTTPNGEVYDDVLQADIVVSASTTAEYNGIDIPIMLEQNAIMVTNYYANGVGMIYSSMTRNIEFEDLSSFGLPNLPDVHSESSQELNAHTLN